MRAAYTRREVGAALLAAAPALAAVPPQQETKAQDPLEEARRSVREAAGELAAFPLEMSKEPSFVFKP
ncbi:MAG: hypothetical protein KIT09_02680 [Bryobacteraceae bacterium]|nr:hypothetical protein [Bryobacteraceae bacterium]